MAASRKQRPVVTSLVMNARFILFLTVFLLRVLSICSQQSLITASGTYGIVKNVSPERSFDKMVAGLQLGLEYPFKKRFSFGGDLAWQSVDSYSATVKPVSPASGRPEVGFVVKNNQISARIYARYYPQRTLNGFYLGLFTTFTAQMLSSSGYPDDGAYPEKPDDLVDHYYRGGGLTYGYRFKLSKSLGAHTFLMHQMLWDNDNPDFRQQNHQVGLGLHFSM